MTRIDIACYERGCACYDSRVADETVDVVEKRTWVGLTDKEVENLCLTVGAEPIEVRLIEAKLKEKNT